MKFAITRFYPVDHTAKIVWLEPKLRASQAVSARPGCQGVSGFQLDQQWVEMEAAGYQLKQSQTKDPRGGHREGSGRPFVGVKTARLKINKSIHDQLIAHVANLKRTSGKSVSVQDVASQLIMTAAPNWSAIVPEIRTWGEPWAWVSLTETASNELDHLRKKIKPIRPDIYVNKSNVFCAIVLMNLGRK